MLQNKSTSVIENNSNLTFINSEDLTV